MTSPPMSPARTTGVSGPAMPVMSAPPPGAVSNPSTPRNDLTATAAPPLAPRDLIESGIIPPATRSTMAIVSQSHQPPRFVAQDLAQPDAAGCGELSAEVTPKGWMGWTGWTEGMPHVCRAANGSVLGAAGGAIGGIEEASKRCVATYSSMPSPRR
jgi:hypothetical protein